MALTLGKIKENKTAVFEHIRDVVPRATRPSTLEKAIDPKTQLGAFFWTKRHSISNPDLNSGTLGKITKAISEIKSITASREARDAGMTFLSKTPGEGSDGGCRQSKNPVGTDG